MKQCEPSLVDRWRDVRQHLDKVRIAIYRATEMIEMHADCPNNTDLMGKYIDMELVRLSRTLGAFEERP